MTVDHVDFPKLTDLYFKYKNGGGIDEWPLRMDGNRE